MNEIHIQCPYCHQAISIALDTGVFEHTNVIEDCEVCCRPIEVSYDVKEGEITSYSYESVQGNEF
jgi:hypothetical protein